MKTKSTCQPAEVSGIFQDSKKTDSTSWREKWRLLKLAHCAIPGYGSAKQFWANKKMVKTVYMKGKKQHDRMTEMRLEAMKIPEGARVLDIGAGPGTYAVPLAVRGCNVTVIEPSPVMREALAQNMQDNNADSRIRVIPKRWEDVRIDELEGPFDVVIASYSLTMMDMGKALEKMQACTTGTVHLFWFMTEPAWVKVNRDLWPLLHGGTFPGEPLADWLWMVLCEMGIYANIQIETKSDPPVYQSVDDAVEEFSRRLNASTPEHTEIIRNYFQAVLCQDKTGYILGNETLGAHIWWTRGR